MIKLFFISCLGILSSPAQAKDRALYYPPNDTEIELASEPVRVDESTELVQLKNLVVSAFHALWMSKRKRL